MTLSIAKQIEELNELIHWDLDAVGAYNEAIESVLEPMIRDPLIQFRSDHQRHIADLSQVVRELGGKPPRKPDLKGMARRAMTKVAGLVGTETVLHAMRSNEEAINQAYDHHLQFGFPQDVLDLIRRNFQDEQRHFEWVTQILRARPWETQAESHP